MKQIKFLLALVLFCNLLTACSNDQFDEEEALFNIEDYQLVEDVIVPIDDDDDGKG